MQYLGDYTEDYATLNFYFSSHKADGTPATLSGTPAISVYKGSSTTQITAGITLNVDFDGVTGLNHVLIDLSADALYEIANDYAAVITAGTVDSVSVVGMVVGHFSIENRNTKANVTKINSVAAAAAILAKSVQTVLDCTVDNQNFTPTATEFETSSLSDSDADGMVGRVIIFISGNRIHEASIIAANSLISGKVHFIVSPAFPGAPANTDGFLIF